ncbi:MAG: heme-binding protein [Thermomicrobiales bacterium]
MAHEPEDETLAYRVIDHAGEAEIREYAPRLTAETPMNDGDGIQEGQDAAFERLANYIFAKERQGDDTPIAMTAPVAMDPAGGGHVMRFFMPAEYRADSLPQPGNAAVQLAAMPAQTLAALRFAGYAGDALVEQKTAALMQSLLSSAWEADGAPGFFGYDPPWTPPADRRNEVTVPVRRRSA